MLPFGFVFVLLLEATLAVLLALLSFCVEVEELELLAFACFWAI